MLKLLLYHLKQALYLSYETNQHHLKFYQNQILANIIAQINEIRENRAKNIIPICSIKNNQSNNFEE